MNKSEARNPKSLAQTGVYQLVAYSNHERQGGPGLHGQENHPGMSRPWPRPWITGLVAYNKPKRQGGQGRPKQIQNPNSKMFKTVKILVKYNFLVSII
jgi:hypothetical protein